MTNRLDYIDTAKGIGMLIVFMLHVSIGFSNNEYSGSLTHLFVSNFFMPLFFILSGLFFSVKSDFKPWLIKKTQRLVVPYICFYILTYVMNVGLHTIGVKTKNPFHYYDIFQVFWTDVYSNNVIWFLLALYWSSIVVYFIIKYSKNYFFELFLVALAYFVGYYCELYSYNIPLYIDTAMSAVPLLYIGVLLKRSNALYVLTNMSKGVKYSVLLVIVAIMGIVNFYTEHSISMVNNYCGNPILYLIGSFAGTMCVLAFSMMIGRVPVLTYLGANSMIMLCVHMYLINALVKVMNKVGFGFWESWITVIVILCLSTYMIAPFFRKNLPEMVGEKRN